MRFKVIRRRDQIFTHHQIVMWPSNKLPYFVCHLPLALGATEGTGATWRATWLMDMWSLESTIMVNQTKGTRVDYNQVRGRGLTLNEIFNSSIFIILTLDI